MTAYRDWLRSQKAAAKGAKNGGSDIRNAADSEIRNAAEQAHAEIRNATENFSGTPRKALEADSTAGHDTRARAESFKKVSSSFGPKSQGAAAAVFEDSPPPPPTPAAPLFESPTAEDMDLVTTAIGEYATPDDAGVRRIIKDCREVRPDATGEEIAHFVRVKGHELRRRKNVTNMFGLLTTSVPECLGQHSFDQYRARQRAEEDRAHAAPQESSPPRWENAGMWIGDKHHWDELSEEQRQFYREMFPDECPD
jgi:hypothetical protein